MKKTLVLGASPNPERYANKAINMLVEYGHPVLAVALRESSVGDIPIRKPESIDPNSEIDTITLYIGPQNQLAYYDFILNLEPKRLLFNPGTENNELSTLAHEAGIEVVEHCTLVMLNQGIY